MSSSCGCSGDDLPAGEEVAPPPRLWEVRRLQLAALSGVLLLVAYLVGEGTAQLVLEGAALVAGALTFVPEAMRNLLERRIGIDTLMTIAAGGAVLLGQVGEAAALAFLFAIAEGLESWSMARTRYGLRALLSLVPERATVLRDGLQVDLAPAELQVGDLLLVKPGERVATDGVVRTGRTALDVSAITGESVPVEVSEGDAVFAASVNGGGAIEVEVTARTADNTLARVVRAVEDARAKKGAAQRLADSVARPLVPGVLVLSALAGAAQELSDALIINPYDVDGFASALLAAMDMLPDDRRARMAAMRRVVAGRNVFGWASDILEGLESLWTKPLHYSVRRWEELSV